MAKKSHFLITINTNQTGSYPGPSEEALRSGLHSFVDGYLAPMTKETWPKGEAVEELFTSVRGYELNLTSIYRIKIKYGVERGKRIRGMRIHAHIHMMVEHATYLHISVPTLKSWANDHFRSMIGKDLYVNVKGYGTVGDNFDAYVTKDYEDLPISYKDADSDVELFPSSEEEESQYIHLIGLDHYSPSPSPSPPKPVSKKRKRANADERTAREAFEYLERQSPKKMVRRGRGRYG
jgi:hypothetical protein